MTEKNSIVFIKLIAIQMIESMKLVITDNAYINGHEGWLLEQCVEDPSISPQKHAQTIRDLAIIGGKSLSEIISGNPNSLSFPIR